MFSELSLEEEQKFRNWARENYFPTAEGWSEHSTSELWHPVVRDEWAKLKENLRPQAHHPISHCFLGLAGLASFELKDIHSGDKQTVPVEVVFQNGALFLRPKGTGDAASLEEGYPIMLEYYEKSVRLVVWSDINQQDPTHIIFLDGAKVSEFKS